MCNMKECKLYVCRLNCLQVLLLAAGEAAHYLVCLVLLLMNSPSLEVSKSRHQCFPNRGVNLEWNW